MDLKCRNILIKICVELILVFVLGCNFAKNRSAFLDSSASGGGAETGTGIGTGTGAGTGTGVGAGVNGFIGSGTGQPGQGDLSVPTGKAALLRILNGLEGNASIYQPTLLNVFPQLVSNFTNTTDPMSFSGAGTNMLLAYSACADVSNYKLSFYSINTALTLAANKPALVNAGLRILDHHTAGLASGSSVTPQVTAALSALVDQSIADGVNVQVAFVTMCTAASSAASTMLGF